MKLTNQACKSAKPKDKPYKMFDGGGLYLEIMPTGSKLWRLKYRHLDKEKKLCIGAFQTISLAEARGRRREAKILLVNGLDPSAVKQQQKQDKIEEASNTFELIAREWYEHEKLGWSKANSDQIIRRLEKDVFPIIGSKPIKEINHKMLLDLAKSVQKRGAYELGKRIIQMSKQIFQHAIITGRADRNIAADLKGEVKSRPVKHYAAIEAKDIPQFIKDLENHRYQLKPQTYLAMKFMMLTFLRTGEMIAAEWDEFDFEERIWTVPASRMKMDKSHIVPLCEQSIAILHELRDLHSNPKYVFPSRINRDGHMSNTTLLMALKRMGYKGKMTGHGFRSLAMSTIMERLEYRYEIPDAQLAHAKKGDVERAYSRAKYLPDRIKMMQDWANYLDNLAA